MQIARLQERPTTLDYIPYIFDSFMELHGDRNFRDDPAMIGGIGFLNGRCYGYWTTTRKRYKR